MIKYHIQISDSDSECCGQTEKGGKCGLQWLGRAVRSWA